MIIDDERRENASGLLMSLNMLIETPGGFYYTGADCSSVKRYAAALREGGSLSSKYGYRKMILL
jgi:hypothetical protein